MLGQTPSNIGPNTPCPTCMILDGGPFQDSRYPFPDCPCPEGFEKQVVNIKAPDTDEIVTTYRFCKPKGDSCIGRKADVVRQAPDLPKLDALPPEKGGPDWLLILGGIGVAGLLYHRYKSLR